MCASGIGIHCGPPLCFGRVNCALRQWNSTVCCNKECLASSPVGRFASPASSMTADDNGNINNNDPNQQQPQDNRDYQHPSWISRTDGGPLYSLDGDGIYGVSGGRRTINGDETYPEDNVTAVSRAELRICPVLTILSWLDWSVVLRWRCVLFASMLWESISHWEISSQRNRFSHEGVEVKCRNFFIKKEAIIFLKRFEKDLELSNGNSFDSWKNGRHSIHQICCRTLSCYFSLVHSGWWVQAQKGLEHF